MQTVQQINVGLLNDLHYDGSVQALNRLYESISLLNLGGANVMILLGDLLEAEGEAQAKRLLREVAALCDSFRGEIHYMPGNHDLDHLSKDQFYAALGREKEASTFSFKHEGIDFICIDGNFSPDGKAYQHGDFDWKESYIPEDQLLWLREQLEAAAFPAVILSHQRIDISCMHSVRNHEAVRAVINQSQKVKAVFQGHQHADDLRQLEGVTYYTLSAHKDDAGPGMVYIDPKNIRLFRDFRLMEPA
jgi:predicted phosphodiesterase